MARAKEYGMMRKRHGNKIVEGGWPHRHPDIGLGTAGASKEGICVFAF